MVDFIVHLIALDGALGGEYDGAFDDVLDGRL